MVVHFQGLKPPPRVGKCNFTSDLCRTGLLRLNYATFVQLQRRLRIRQIQSLLQNQPSPTDVTLPTALSTIAAVCGRKAYFLAPAYLHIGT
jgi:hypothetical protein